MRRNLPAVLLAVSLAFPVSGPVFAQRNLSGTPQISLALDRLTVLGSVLMIAAHPDDENTAALAYWARGRKLQTAYLSATRGEGGQNLIGSEQGDLLGVIRTQELLAARRVDGAEQFFTRAIDFGFSKTPQETIQKWGHDAILSDMVWVIRRYRPDVVVLRFSGTPKDGHGQHQASAILGKEAYFAAADPKKFPEQLQFVKPWQAKRLMFNTFNFTPEMEKESAALPNRIEFDTGEFNPILGKSYGEIAGLSRDEHRSQAMGSPERRGPGKNTLVTIAGDPAKQDLFDGIDITWNRVPGGVKAGELLARAAAEFIPAHPEKSIPLLLRARPVIQALAEKNELWAERKLKELDEAVALCSGLWMDAEADKFTAVPAGKLTVTLNAINRSAFPVGAVNVKVGERSVTVAAALQPNQPVAKPVELTVPANAAYTEPFWLAQHPQGSLYRIDDPLLIGRPDPVPAMTAEFTVIASGTELHFSRPVRFRYVDRLLGELTRPLTIGPPVSVDLPNPILVFTNKDSRPLTIQVRANSGAAKGDVHVEADPGWRVEPALRAFELKTAGEQQEVMFTVTPVDFGSEAGTPPAHFRAWAAMGGASGVTDVRSGIQVIAYPHIDPQTLAVPSIGSLRKAPLEVLAKRVGYVMGAGDEVPEALRQMGCEVSLLTADELASGNLARFDAIVTGVRAYNVRPDLLANQGRLLDYVRNGGALVVQYNVLEDRRFNPRAEPGLERLGPYPFKLSRDRVTVEEAPVEFLSMKNPLLRAPNPISQHDFDGWVQERGLYFASEWDPRYEPVLSTHDPNEKSLNGGELFTRYGKGAYVFTSYSWFRQLPAGVPGAYRLFANMLSAAKAK